MQLHETWSFAEPILFLFVCDQAWGIGIDLNLNAHFNLIHAFLPHFQENKSGNIIHFTTIASSVGLGIKNQRHAYAAGKAAAATLTKRIGVENATNGIRANVIGIGYVTGPLVNRAVAQAVAGGADTTIEKVTAVRDAYVPRQTQITPEEVNLAFFPLCLPFPTAAADLLLRTAPPVVHAAAVRPRTP